jgi:ATP-binding cassette subfamily B protein/subfamily B ATP-binding cassette protein MsbA
MSIASKDNSAELKPGLTRLPEDAYLSAGLGELFRRPVEVTSRERNVYTSTYESEIVECRVADGRELELFCKYGHIQTLPLGHSSWGARSGLAYEAAVYEQILERSSLRTATFFGAYRPPWSDELWLVLQYVGTHNRVSKQPDPGMVRAAAWLGGFHREQAARLSQTNGLLTVYDETYYRSWLERTLEFQPQRLEWLERLAESFDEVLPLLSPDAVIHGEYYPRNVLLDDGQVYPVDWESAAIAAGEIDLAMLTEAWGADVIEQCERGYTNARWPEGEPDAFRHRLEAARLFVGLRFLGDDAHGARDDQRIEALRQGAEHLTTETSGNGSRRSGIRQSDGRTSTESSEQQPVESNEAGAESTGHHNRRWLVRYAKPQWRGLLVLLGLMCVSIGLGLLAPWPTKILVDNVLGDQAMSNSLANLFDALPGPNTKEWWLAWVALVTVLLFLANTFVSMLSAYKDIGVRQRLTYSLGADLFHHLQRLSLVFHSRRPVGDTIARVTGDPSCVPMVILDAILPAVQSLVLLITMFAIMWALEPSLTLAALLVVPFLVLSIRAFGGKMKQRSRVRRDLEGRMMSLVQQTLTAMPAVQAFTREDLEHSRFRSYADDTVAAYERSTFSSLWFKLFVGLSTSIGTAVVIFLGGTLVIDGDMTIGTLLVFLAYLSSLYGPLNSLTYTTQTLSYAYAQADRVREVLDVPIEVEDDPDAPIADMRGIVRYEGVTFGYETGRPVLKGVSLEAGPGEVVAIVGPTGAGKTTLVNLLIRFSDPWEGVVTVGDEDLRTFRVRSVREQVALVLQEPFIFPFTVAENIAYGRPDATREAIVAAAEAANAHEFIMRLPEGYDSVIGERGATLSGGEKQRLSIARAFLKDAPVLILDEPTSALDARTEGMLLDALERLMKGRLTFIIAHRLSTIRNATQILVLDHGEIVERGAHDALLANDGLYATLYNRQMDIARHESPGSIPVPGVGP